MDHSSHMASATTGMDASMTMSMDHSQTSEAMSMGDHSSHGSGNGCQISMLWNWNVMDACFLSESWHITSNGMFAGSCIGVILLVIALEFLRRSVKEFDRYLVRQHIAKFESANPAAAAAAAAARAGYDNGNSKDNLTAGATACAPIPASQLPAFRPNVIQQAVRALLHMLQFAVAYFIMLLAMYYNGYIIICIFIGAYLGAFIFHWEPLTASGQQTSASREATVCCG